MEPLGLDGGISRAVKHMKALAALADGHGAALTVVVYPWPAQLALNDRTSRSTTIWQNFCVHACKSFVDLFPAFFEVKDRDADWYRQLFIPGDVHYSAEGNRLVFRELSKHLL